MSALTEAQAIKRKFQRAWDDLECPVQYENVEFMTEGLGLWARFTILDGETDLAGLGTDSARRKVGIISIELFTSTGIGTKEILTKADEAAAIFDCADFDGIDCRAASVKKQGVTGVWYKVNVTIPFYNDRQP